MKTPTTELIGTDVSMMKVAGEMLALGMLGGHGEAAFRAAEDRGIDMKLKAADLIEAIGEVMADIGTRTIATLPDDDIRELSEREVQCMVVGFLGGAGRVAGAVIRAICEQVNDEDLTAQAVKLDAEANHGANLDGDG